MFLPPHISVRADAEEPGYTPHKPPSVAIILSIFAAVIMMLTPFFYNKIALIRRCFHTRATHPPRRTILCLTPETLELMPITKYQTSLRCNHDGAWQKDSNSHITISNGCQECSVCTEDFLEDIGIRSQPCGHRFHPECIDPWLLERSVTCPMCRVSTITGLLMAPKMPARPRRVLSVPEIWTQRRTRPRVSGDLPVLTTVLTIQSGGPGTAIQPRPFRRYQTPVPTVAEILEQVGPAPR